MSELIFTPASVLDLLLQIDELSEYDIGLSETMDGNVQLQIGNSIYEIELNDAEDLPVEENIVDTVSEINEDAYADIADTDLMDSYQDDYMEDEPIESGILAEAAKSLLLGGMIKLSAKLLK